MTKIYQHLLGSDRQTLGRMIDKAGCKPWEGENQSQNTQHEGNMSEHTSNPTDHRREDTQK